MPDGPPAASSTLIERAHYGSDPEFEDALYERFRRDFLGPTWHWEGKRVGLKAHPLRNGREATFYHLTTNGTEEASRTLDLARAERIGWIRPLIEKAEREPTQVRRWLERRGRQERIHLATPSFDYLVVLTDRGEYVLPWTAYFVAKLHSRRKLRSRWEQFS